MCMEIYIGADHGGFSRKELLCSVLSDEGFSVLVCGAKVLTTDDDYPQYALDVAGMVQVLSGAFGVLLCRSGEGMAMAANRFSGVRAAVIWNQQVAEETRRDNNATIAVIPVDFLNEEQTIICIRRFLATPFSEEVRHQRRIAAIEITP